MNNELPSVPENEQSSEPALKKAKVCACRECHDAFRDLESKYWDIRELHEKVCKDHHATMVKKMRVIYGDDLSTLFCEALFFWQQYDQVTGGNRSMLLDEMLLLSCIPRVEKIDE